MSRPGSGLMSFIICDLISKSDQTVAQDAWVEIIESRRADFTAAGAIRQTVTQIWNKQDVFKLGFMWEYKAEKAFIDCQKLFRQVENEFSKKTGIVWKINANSGVILTDMVF